LWLVGGGSGHGFKHGPAVGELVAETVLERRKPEPQFLLARFGAPTTQTSDAKRFAGAPRRFRTTAGAAKILARGTNPAVRDLKGPIP